MASRRQARHDAMVILYQHDLTGTGIDELLAGFAAEHGYEADRFTEDEVRSVEEASGRLDDVIDSCSIDWPASRLAPLERSILRIAVYEMMERPDIPLETSIDEAVTLAKRFCSREAGVLINGILGKLAEDLHGES